MSDNLCDIYRYVNKVLGISSTDVKDRFDTWILHIDNETIKIKISIKNVEVRRRIYLKDVDHSSVYETRTYNYVRNNLQNTYVVPKFITFLNSGECKYENLRKILEKDISIKDIDRKLHRNLTLVANTNNLIPSINSDEEIVKGVLKKYISPRWKYNVQSFINIDTSYTFNKYINDRGEKFLDLGDPNCYDDLMIIFNVCIICYAMSLSVMSHCNMLLENIALSKLREVEKISYELFDTSERFSFDMNMRVILTNFQNAFVRNLGQKKSEMNNNCINENLDIMTVFYGIFEITEKYGHVHDLLYPLLVYSVDEGLDFTKNDDLYKFNSTEEITINFYNMLRSKNMLSNVSGDEDIMFVCKQSLFEGGGEFIGSGSQNKDGIEEEEYEDETVPSTNNYVFDLDYFINYVLFDILPKYKEVLTPEEKKEMYIKYLDTLLEKYDMIKNFLNMVGQENRLKKFSDKYSSIRDEFPEIDDPKYNDILN